MTACREAAEDRLQEKEKRNEEGGREEEMKNCN